MAYINRGIISPRRYLIKCPYINVLLLEGNSEILGNSEVTANIYYKSRNLPNTDTQNYSTDLR